MVPDQAVLFGISFRQAQAVAPSAGGWCGGGVSIPPTCRVQLDHHSTECFSLHAELLGSPLIPSNSWSHLHKSHHNLFARVSCQTAIKKDCVGLGLEPTQHCWGSSAQLGGSLSPANTFCPPQTGFVKQKMHHALGFPCWLVRFILR